MAVKPNSVSDWIAERLQIEPNKIIYTIDKYEYNIIHVYVKENDQLNHCGCVILMSENELTKNGYKKDDKSISESKINLKNDIQHRQYKSRVLFYYKIVVNFMNVRDTENNDIKFIEHYKSILENKIKIILHEKNDEINKLKESSAKLKSDIDKLRSLELHCAHDEIDAMKYAENEDYKIMDIVYCKEKIDEQIKEKYEEINNCKEIKKIETTISSLNKILNADEVDIQDEVANQDEVAIQDEIDIQDVEYDSDW